MRMGILSAGPPSDQARAARLTNPTPFWATLKDLGWTYGRNRGAEDRWGDSVDRLRAGAVDLVRLKVDVLWSPGFSPAAHLLREAKAIPIVVFQAGVDLIAERDSSLASLGQVAISLARKCFRAPLFRNGSFLK